MNGERGVMNLGKWTQERLEKIIAKAAEFRLAGRKIDFISRQFLGMHYREGTLIGNEKTSEVFVVDLSGVDCFTFIDYVEALRLSDSISTFKNNLKQIRYRSGTVAFNHRNHFFSDWSVFNRDLIEDATVRVGGGHARSSEKKLNVKEDGTLYLPGIAPIDRIVEYIPAGSINESVIGKCETGDYIGIYADNPGLDVTHVGIVIKDQDEVYLRHASSLPEYRKVIDQGFLSYMVGKGGFLVLRPKDKKQVRSQEVEMLRS
jgi:hypothetical protein